MERTLWILSYFSSRVAIIILGVMDYLIIKSFSLSKTVIDLFNTYKLMIILIGIITCILCILCGIKGGKLGYQYVEMGRSRQWHYRANEYKQKDDRLKNTIYWAGKFACFPLVIVFFIILIAEIIYITKYLPV